MTAIRPGMPKPKPKKGLPPGLLRALENLLILSGLAALFSLTFLLYVVLSGQLSVPLIAGSALEVIQRNMLIALQVFTIALWVVVVAALVRYRQVESIGYLIGLAGLGCYLGMSMLVKNQMTPTSAAQLQAVAQQLVDSFQTTGGALLVLAFLRVVGGRLVALAYAPRGAVTARIPGSSALAEIAEERARGRPSLMRKCWELHYCRGSLRMTCPRFVEGVACWKRRSGCYCDQDLQTRLLSQMAAKARVQVAEEMDAVRTRAQLPQRVMAQRKKQQALRESGAACRECPLYLDHQKFKYRALSWVSYPLAAVLIAIFANQIRYGYHWVETSLGGWLSALQVLPQSTVDSQFQKIPLISAENAMIVMLGVLTAALILQVTELVVFKFKW
jgi:hypothetical protein